MLKYFGRVFFALCIAEIQKKINMFSTTTDCVDLHGWLRTEKLLQLLHQLEMNNLLLGEPVSSRQW